MIVIFYIILGVYCLSVGFISFYCISQLYLWHYYRKAVQPEQIPSHQADSSLPSVTVQLPIFNESYVSERIIQHAIQLDYPSDKLHIQVLDDSTDDTLLISRNAVKRYRSMGHNIELIHRKDRKGYKAGALAAGLRHCESEFIAIFDADFMPAPDFLLKTLSYFNSRAVSTVQTRWGHLNQDYNLLTRLQAFQLDVHFTVEQLGRATAGLFLQFNGTAGVWRREAIINAGGWSADTLTEDLDLSLRSQLSQQSIVYLEGLTTFAELPVEMSSLRTQQYRWMKGGAEVARKFIVKLWKSSSNLELDKKILTSLHLCSSSIFLVILIMGVSSLPLSYLISQYYVNMVFLSFGLLGLLVTGIVYYEANVRRLNKMTLAEFFLFFPIFLTLSMGLSYHNGIAVAQGWMGIKTAFIRTPKFNVRSKTDLWRSNKYLASRIPAVVWIEAILGICFSLMSVWGIATHSYTFVILHFIFGLGFLSISIFSLRDIWHREGKT